MNRGVTDKADPDAWHTVLMMYERRSCSRLFNAPSDYGAPFMTQLLNELTCGSSSLPAPVKAKLAAMHAAWTKLRNGTSWLSAIGSDTRLS
jgi:hypothetical protein